ncbi:MAG: DUF2202 domain-containing protein [Melioribacteraceae bacterium]|nr:DUF2202 domain-containing protein [Melioribacteraceae bacterium]
MKTIKAILFFFLIITSISLILSGCGSDSTVNSLEDSIADLNKYSQAADVYGEIDEDERNDLIFMREEEKAARDVYLKMYELHNLRVFRNIARSEQKHMDAIKILLDRYGIADPVGENPAGVFENDELQDLYNTLIAKGSESLTSALEAGALIEETDILDLKEALEVLEDNSDIAIVYNRLLKGSNNHLRAFVKNLARLGITYTPQVLDEESYNEIINK